MKATNLTIYSKNNDWMKIPYIYLTWCNVIVVVQCPQWQDQPKTLNKKN